MFRLDPTGNLHILYEFTGGSDGSQPYGPLREDAAGNLYGIALQGGNLSCAEFPQVGCGTVFKLSQSGEFTVLHIFQGGSDGAAPQPGGLFLDNAGNLVGATASGGVHNNGLLFGVSKDGSYRVVHEFGGVQGIIPNGGLIADSSGNLYGTTEAGGEFGVGTVYELSRTGKLTVLHPFEGDVDGATPLAGVIRDAQGNLYGTAFQNLLIQQTTGDVFKITP